MKGVRWVVRPAERFVAAGGGWVRASPLPLARLVSKHGPPDDAGHDGDSMEPFRTWTKTKVTVLLTDDEASLGSVDFGFTDEEVVGGLKINMGRSERSETPSPPETKK